MILRIGFRCLRTHFSLEICQKINLRIIFSLKLSSRFINPVRRVLEPLNPNHESTSPKQLNPAHEPAYPEPLNPSHKPTYPKQLNPDQEHASPKQLNPDQEPAIPEPINPTHNPNFAEPYLHPIFSFDRIPKNPPKISKTKNVPQKGDFKKSGKSLFPSKLLPCPSSHPRLTLPKSYADESR